MSDLERAQEWLGCERMTDDADVVHCGPHNDLAPDHEWPCPEAARLAALLAETRADEDRLIRDALLEGAGKDEARGLKEPAKAQRAVAAWMTRGLEDA